MQAHCHERQLLTNTSLVHVKIASIAQFIKRLNRKWSQNNDLWDIHFISKGQKVLAPCRAFAFLHCSLQTILPLAISQTASFHYSDHKRCTSASCPPLSESKNKSHTRLYFPLMDFPILSLPTRGYQTLFSFSSSRSTICSFPPG